MSVDATQILTQLRDLQAADVPIQGGQTLAYVYDSGRGDVDDLARAAVASFAGSNGLDPTAFPSLLQMENDVVGFTCELLAAPETAVGTITSGGTESVLLAVQTARDARPDITRPRMVVPVTAHAAFHKAAHYFGVTITTIGVDDLFRADIAQLKAELDDDVVLVVASAPSYAHGVIDPVTEIAAAAQARNIRCHVDACIGGWVLGYAARLGRPVPPWTFEVPGVTSISVDLHKYAYAPKGTSVLLHRTPQLRRAQYFASAAWPGYTMLNSTMQSTKSGGPLAGAWATVQAIGHEGYAALTREVLDGLDALTKGVTEIDHLHVVASPDSTLVALATDDALDVFTVADLMGDAGWWVQPQLSFGSATATLHLSLSAATAPRVPQFLASLSAAVEEAVHRGPITPDPQIVEFIEALDPHALTDDDFEGLLVAAGMTSNDGGIGVPEEMAQINALLDIAAPALRESLLIAFLDRLQRPHRQPS